MQCVFSVVCRVQVWNTNTGATLKVFAGVINSHKDNILCVDLSTDNTRLAASATDGTVMVGGAYVHIHTPHTLTVVTHHAVASVTPPPPHTHTHIHTLLTLTGMGHW